jgi:hypothetical protein
MRKGALHEMASCSLGNPSPGDLLAGRRCKVLLSYSAPFKGLTDIGRNSCHPFRDGGINLYQNT